MRSGELEFELPDLVSAVVDQLLAVGQELDLGRIERVAVEHLVMDLIHLDVEQFQFRVDGAAEDAAVAGELNIAAGQQAEAMEQTREAIFGHGVTREARGERTQAPAGCANAQLKRRMKRPPPRGGGMRVRGLGRLVEVAVGSAELHVSGVALDGPIVGGALAARGVIQMGDHAVQNGHHDDGEGEQSCGGEADGCQRRQAAYMHS